MNDEALLREKAATLTRMLNFQGQRSGCSATWSGARGPATDQVLHQSRSLDRQGPWCGPEHMFVYNIDGNHHRASRRIDPAGVAHPHAESTATGPTPCVVVHLHAPHGPARLGGRRQANQGRCSCHGSFLCNRRARPGTTPRLVVNDAQGRRLVAHTSAGIAARRCAGHRQRRGGARVPREAFFRLHVPGGMNAQNPAFRPRSWAAPFP